MSCTPSTCRHAAVTWAEIEAMFGDSLPIAAAKTVHELPTSPRCPDEWRAQLRDMAVLWKIKEAETPLERLKRIDADLIAGRVPALDDARWLVEMAVRFNPR